MINLSENIAGPHEQGLPPKAARPIHGVIAVACAVLLIAMMGLTVVDVLGRYLLNSPVKGATELTELMLAALIFLGLPAATLDREHVTVDLITDRLPLAIDKIRRPIVLLLSVGVQVMIAWRLWVTASQVAGYGGTTATLELPVAPIGYFSAMLCIVSAVIMFAEIFYPMRGKN
ncbi:TRAP transporter small permease [Celeribacter ethanolicus]|uniref:TRAP transporter small permease n=1 Tax=Celeribacter ethanolicus TaxID=1758178 RepID=UPI0018E08C9B|nr:TRAP transporter small permease [Celeribacter ethanolicus]